MFLLILYRDDVTSDSEDESLPAYVATNYTENEV